MKIVRKKIDHKKEAPINLFNVKGDVTVERAFGKFKGEENEVLVTFKGGAEMKFSDFRKMRGLVSAVYSGNASEYDQEVLWDLIFENFEIEADVEFEQSEHNLKSLGVIILSTCLDTIAQNKKK